MATERFAAVIAQPSVRLTVDGAIYPNNPGNAGADINMEPVWDKITDCRSVVVAIVDTGVNYNHEDLNANMWDGGTSYPNHGFNFSQGTNDPIDHNGHGTHLAGIIGAVGNNGKDGTGICWKANIMAIRAFDQNGSGPTSDIVQGIEFAINHGAKIINMSFGQYGDDATLAAEINKTETAGLLVVAAAGNDAADMSTTSITYPCSYTNSNIICVAALDQKDQLASFSNYGSASVDVGAPGTNIYSSWFADEKVKETFTFASWTQPVGAGNSWAHAISGSGSNGWVIPNNYNGTSNTYLPNTSRRSYNTAGYSDFSACSYVALGLDASVDLGSASVLNINYNNAVGNPFIGGSSLAVVNPTHPIGSRYELTACETNTNCSVGFELLANGTTGFGVALYNYYLYCISATPVSQYFIDHGTSMSTPYVTGLAAILMAYNPNFTYADAKNAILNGGRSVASLSGITTSGNSIDGWGALTYINAPTGVTAVVQ